MITPWQRPACVMITNLTLVAWLMLSATAAAQDVDAFVEAVQPTLARHCLKCHGAGDEVKGDVDLTRWKDSASLTADLELVSELIDVLESGAMPPEEEPPLEQESRDRLVRTLRSQRQEAVRLQKPYSTTPIRRMNRFQYNNAVQDLFDLKVDVFALPERMVRDHGNYFQPASGKMPDTLKAGSRPLGKSQLIDRRLAGVAPFPQDLRAEHGFDNRADHLSLSPLLLESFFKLSRSIVESEDFNEQNCGIWRSFFSPPPESEDENEDVNVAVRQRLDRFLCRAFRRPIDQDTLDRYAAHVTKLIESGQSFTDGMKSAASSAIASPRFLYLYDQPGESDEGDFSKDFELASRLSFFLWGSIPDATLLELTGEGRLRDPDVLGRQVQRMLSDVRLKRFCDSFPSQWLQMERIISSVPDQNLFPEFYFAKFRVSMHMMLEPLLLFETILVEDRSILELIDADFSYRSEMLEQWYRDGTRGNKAPPTAIPFRRVAVNDRRQGGVITNAAVMTMTSGPLRTQPITRGAWVASVIFRDPPEPPPADVPPLAEESAEETAKLTLRERFAAHRDRADCAGCHAKIDPLGFALENYGPTGIWRDVYGNGHEVDSSGTLFRRHAFGDVVEFKDAILAEKDRFARAFAGHLLSFALGRDIGAADEPALESIVQESAGDDFRLRRMIQQIVLSEPFLQHSDSIQPPKSLP